MAQFTVLNGSIAKQSGIALIVSVIMLLLMTLIGVTSSQVTSLEEKMAGNMRDRNMAFQAAESALRAGEALVSASTPTLSCPGATPFGFFVPRDVDCDGILETDNVWDVINWDTQSRPYTNPLVDLSTNPRFIVEDMGAICVNVAMPCPAADVRRNYRITARANGGTTNAVVILQSTIQLSTP